MLQFGEAVILWPGMRVAPPASAGPVASGALQLLRSRARAIDRSFEKPANIPKTGGLLLQGHLRNGPTIYRTAT